MLLTLFRRPYRFFLLAAALALILCLFPIRAREPAQEGPRTAETQKQTENSNQMQGVPAGADLSERTAQGCMLHQTLVYAPCGHSIQRRDPLDPRLVGLTRAALEKEMENVLPGAAVTGFSSGEVDVSVSADIPCPLHWVLKTGEDGFLHVYQNRDGASLSLVRSTDIPAGRLEERERQALLDGRIFDDVQALEGYLESMSS